MKRILLILDNNPYNNGGIERHCRSIIELFKNDKQVNIDYLCKENIPHGFKRIMRKVSFNRNASEQRISR